MERKKTREPRDSPSYNNNFEKEKEHNARKATDHCKNLLQSDFNGFDSVVFNDGVNAFNRAKKL